MTELLLNPAVFLGLLIAAAVLTPIAAAIVARSMPSLPRRAVIAAGAVGPMALVGWGLYNLILSVFGFASVVSLLIVITASIVLGLGVGLWIRAGLEDSENTGESE